MQKKLQVFVSSTFVDLKDERQAAVAGILLAGHIPAGMELFTAGDEGQLEVIKRWIRESDVYMLILGARYGSIEPHKKVSYTEFEYDYAAELGKPSFSIVMSGQLYDTRLREQDEQEPAPARHAYGLFRAKVLNKISSPFESADQIKLGILASLRDISERPSLTGWVRSNEVANVQPLVEELASLQAERDALKGQLATRPILTLGDDGRSLAGLDERFAFPLEYKIQSHFSRSSLAVDTTWGEVFNALAPLLLEIPADIAVNHRVAEYFFKKQKGGTPFLAEFPQDTWGTVKFQFQALGLAEYKYLQSQGGGMRLYWYATEAGKKTALALRAVYSQKS